MTSGHIGWADLIFVMEKKHHRRLQARFRQEIAGKEVICLNIPDEYQCMDSELIDVLTATVEGYVDLTKEPDANAEY